MRIFLRIWTKILALSVLALIQDGQAEIHTDCGGDVELTLGNDTIIEYKFGQNYALNERCQWLLRAGSSSTTDGPQYTVKATLLSHGFKAEAGVALFTVDPERSNLSSYVLASTEEIYEILLHPFTFLCFSTSNYYNGKGFQVRLELRIREEISILPSPKSSVLKYATWHDYTRHPADPGVSSYGLNERLYVLISPPNPYREYWRLNVDFMDIEVCGSDCNCDHLDVYRINGVNGYSRAARLCGVISNDTEHFVTSRSMEPILLVFHSNNETTASGFQVTWEQHN